MSEFELYDMIFLNRLSMSSVFLTILSIDAESFIMMKQPWISRLLATWHDSLYFYVLEIISVLKIWRQKNFIKPHFPQTDKELKSPSVVGITA